MQRSITRTATLITSISASAMLLSCMLSTAHAQSSQVTYIETFDDGKNHSDWTWNRLPGVGTIETADGNPDGFFRSADLMAVPSLFTSHSMFTGDFRARGVNSIGGDLSTVEFASAAGFISIILVHFNGTPDDLFDSSLAHFVTDIEAPVNPTYGWVSFDVPIPSDEEETPPGWVMTGPFPGLPPAVDWNELITNVDEVVVSWSSSLEPVFLFDVTRGADNLRITYQESGPPVYTATVLPQLDTTDDEFILTFTSPSAMNNAKMITGSLGDDRGFAWSPEAGGMILQEQFSKMADSAVGTSVNAAGDIAGSYRPAGQFVSRGFHFAADGAFTELPTLGDQLNGGAADINDAGMIVGSSENAPGGGTFGGPTSAVYWVDGQIVEIGNLGGETGYASAVNNNNVVAGASNTTGDLALQPFRWTEAGGFDVLPQLVAGVPAMAADINDDGIVIGRAGINLFAAEAVYWDQTGNIHVLPRLQDNSIDIDAHAINNAGVIVGEEIPEETWVPEPRLWFDGEVYDLRNRVYNLDPSITLTRAIDINDSGDIVAEASTIIDGAIQFVTVLLSPDTEPVIPGDLNGDGVVDIIDLFMLLGAWGDCEPDRQCTADINGDNVVDVLDLFILLGNWG